MTGPRSEIEVMIEDDRWLSIGADVEAVVVRSAEAALSAAGAEGAAAVLLADDAALHDLNRRWRSVESPTDVLAFPSAARRFEHEPVHLGDIAISYDRWLYDASELGRPPPAHLAHLVVHGALHLCGFDHVDAKDAAVMEPLETRVLASLGWPDPYGDQS